MCLLGGKAESWGCSACRREGSGETLLQPVNIQRGFIRKMGTKVLVGSVMTGQAVMSLT